MTGTQNAQKLRPLTLLYVLSPFVPFCGPFPLAKAMTIPSFEGPPRRSDIVTPPKNIGAARRGGVVSHFEIDEIF